jgi:hypothetical protein
MAEGSKITFNESMLQTDRFIFRLFWLATSYAVFIKSFMYYKPCFELIIKF